ncbi:NAD-dependent epimerase/dehydratase family protein [Candidatus Pelagibacter sp. HIMB1542]|uniref:NAD-dependent epimerase/dehydratase family protein n=1 Tax=Candidatus Pelagibacter sp. HIMB1542 TaxID=3413346 RepID=UPI003F863AE7
MLKKNSKIFLAGHNGMVGSAILRLLKKRGYKNIIIKSKKELDLTNQKKTYEFLKKNKPEYVIIAAALVGGIKKNIDLKPDFLIKNTLIASNIIHGSYLTKIQNLLFLGSSCVYPGNLKKEISENILLKGELEKSNEGYALAKIFGIKLCEYYSQYYKLNYFSLMPCNVFGPGDNYDLDTSHFLPAILKKIKLIKENRMKYLYLWGDGKALREVIYVEDLADACLFFLKKKNNPSLINIGTDIEYSIKNFAKQIMKILDVKTEIKFHKTNIKGTYRKKLDTTLSKKLGWKYKTKFSEAIIKTYELL